MTMHNSVIAIFKSHQEAEEAVKGLEHSGFDMKKLSIAARDYHTEERVVGYYNTGDRVKYWGTQGAFWGGLWGLLSGSAFFLVPVMGPLVVAGPLVLAIAAALENAIVIGSLSVFGAGLFSLGIPENSLLEYETALTAGKFVLIASGSQAEVIQAQDIIRGAKPEKVIQHNS